MQRPKEKIKKNAKGKERKTIKSQKRWEKGKSRKLRGNREKRKRKVKPPNAEITQPQVTEPNVHYSVPMKSVFSLMNNFCDFITYPSNLSFNIVFPSTPKASKWSYPFG